MRSSTAQTIEVELPAGVVSAYDQLTPVHEASAKK